MEHFNINIFIATLQYLTPEEAIYEIGAAGLTNDQIAYCVKEITFNDSFKFTKE